MKIFSITLFVIVLSLTGCRSATTAVNKADVELFCNAVDSGKLSTGNETVLTAFCHLNSSRQEKCAAVMLKYLLEHTTDKTKLHQPEKCERLKTPNYAKTCYCLNPPNSTLHRYPAVLEKLLKAYPGWIKSDIYQNIFSDPYYGLDSFKLMIKYKIPFPRRFKHIPDNMIILNEVLRSRNQLDGREDAILFIDDYALKLHILNDGFVFPNTNVGKLMREKLFSAAIKSGDTNFAAKVFAYGIDPDSGFLHTNRESSLFLSGKVKTKTQTVLYYKSGKKFYKKIITPSSRLSWISSHCGWIYQVLKSTHDIAMIDFLISKGAPYTENERLEINKLRNITSEEYLKNYNSSWGLIRVIGCLKHGVKPDDPRIMGEKPQGQAPLKTVDSFAILRELLAAGAIKGIEERFLQEYKFDNICLLAHYIKQKLAKSKVTQKAYSKAYKTLLTKKLFRHLKNLTITKFLITEGADPKVENEFGTLFFGNYLNARTAKYLVAKGANINKPNRHGQKPWQYVFKDLELYKFYLDYGANRAKMLNIANHRYWSKSYTSSGYLRAIETGINNPNLAWCIEHLWQEK